MSNYIEIDLADHEDDVRDYARDQLGMVQQQSPVERLHKAVANLGISIEQYQTGLIDYYEMYKKVTRYLGPFHTAYYDYRDEVTKGGK